MEHFDKEYCLEIWGDYACFTRPEMKVERVSYDVITPSSARAIFEAVFWKPAIRWQVTRIEVLNPIRWMNIKRNEVGMTMSARSDGFRIEDYRQQKSSLILRDVRYRIFARQVFIPTKHRRVEDQRPEAKDENPGKYNAMFERRASKGQCFSQPYLGCREYSCDFRLIEPAVHGEGIDESRDLGLMLYDMNFKDQYGEEPADPMFYHAVMKHGVIIVPDKDSEEVLR